MEDPGEKENESGRDPHEGQTIRQHDLQGVVNEAQKNVPERFRQASDEHLSEQLDQILQPPAAGWVLAERVPGSTPGAIGTFSGLFPHEILRSGSSRGPATITGEGKVAADPSGIVGGTPSPRDRTRFVRSSPARPVRPGRAPN